MIKKILGLNILLFGKLLVPLQTRIGRLSTPADKATPTGFPRFNIVG